MAGPFSPEELAKLRKAENSLAGSIATAGEQLDAFMVRQGFPKPPPGVSYPLPIILAAMANKITELDMLLNRPTDPADRDPTDHPGKRR